MVCFGHFDASFSMALLVKLIYLQLLTTLTSLYSEFKLLYNGLCAVSFQGIFSESPH